MTKAPKPYAHLEARTERQFDTVEAIFSSRSKVYLDRINRLVSDPDFSLAVEHLNRSVKSYRRFDTRAEAEAYATSVNEDPRFRRTSPVRSGSEWVVDVQQFTGATFEELVIEASTGNELAFWAIYARLLPRMEYNAQQYGVLRESDGEGAVIDPDAVHQEQAAKLVELIENFDGNTHLFRKRFESAARYLAMEAYTYSRPYTMPGRDIVDYQSALRDADGDMDEAKYRLTQQRDERHRWSEAHFYAVARVVNRASRVEMEDAETTAGADYGASDLLSSVESGFDNESLSDAWDVLDDRARLILTKRFGIGGSTPETPDVIAKSLELTTRRVQQIVSASVDTLKTQMSRPNNNAG